MYGIFMGAVAYGSGRLRELLITKFTLQFKWGFAEVVVTRADRLQEWLRGRAPHCDQYSRIRDFSYLRLEKQKKIFSNFSQICDWVLPWQC